MFDGHAFLIVLVAFTLAGLGFVRWCVAARRADADVRWARQTIPTPETPEPRLIRVVCGQCGTELCDVLTPRDADLESESHRLAVHGGAR